MREDGYGRRDRGPQVGGAHNVVALPNLRSGRLADLLAAASGPGQAHELVGEPEARAAFRAVSASWPTPRRRNRRTPAVLAATTVATLMVATTGLAAASELPGPAVRAVQGLLGSVGVTINPTPAVGTGSPVAPPTAVVPTTAPPATAAHQPAGTRHVGGARGVCVVPDGGSGATGGGAVTASCTVSSGHHLSAPVAPFRASRPAAPAVVRPTTTSRGIGPTGALHQGTKAGGQGSASDSVPVVVAGTGSTRGGNLSGSGSTCPSATSTTDPATSTTDPATSTTDPGRSASGCRTRAVHHHPRAHRGAVGPSGTAVGTDPSVPATSASATSAPATSAPATSAPATSAPATTGPGPTGP